MRSKKSGMLSRLCSVSMFVMVLSFVASAAESTDAIPGGPDAKSETFMSAGGGVAVYNGHIGWAMNLGVLKQVSDDSPFFVGGNLGLNLWSYSPNTTTPGTYGDGTTSVSILPTAIFRKAIPGSDTIFPYLGVSAGPSYVVDRQTIIAVGGSSSKNTNSSFVLELLFRPGFYTQITKSFALNVEGTLGVLGSQFIFAPSANLVVAL